MPADGMTEGKLVDGEEVWTRNRDLTDPTGDRVVAGSNRIPRATNSVLPVRYDSNQCRAASVMPMACLRR